MTGSSPGSRNAGESSSAHTQPDLDRHTDTDDSSNGSALLADDPIEDNPRFQ